MTELTTADLSYLFKVSRSQISVWHNGAYGFPRPVGKRINYKSGRPALLWDEAAVRAWMVKTGRWDEELNRRTVLNREKPALPETRAWAERMGWA